MELFLETVRDETKEIKWEEMQRTPKAVIYI
jgi:hypothetical protein